MDLENKNKIKEEMATEELKNKSVRVVVLSRDTVELAEMLKQEEPDTIIVRTREGIVCRATRLNNYNCLWYADDVCERLDSEPGKEDK